MYSLNWLIITDWSLFKKGPIKVGLKDAGLNDRAWTSYTPKFGTNLVQNYKNNLEIFDPHSENPVNYF